MMVMRVLVWDISNILCQTKLNGEMYIWAEMALCVLKFETLRMFPVSKLSRLLVRNLDNTQNVYRYEFL